MKKKEALVVGAGPAGLVAAINLAREGFKVRVFEKEKQIGGYPHWHPSAHDTPVGKDLFRAIRTGDQAGRNQMVMRPSFIPTRLGSSFLGNWHNLPSQKKF